MKPLPIPRAWLGVGAALLAGLACGCSHCRQDHCSSTCSGCVSAAPSKQVVDLKPVQSKPAVAIPAPTVSLPLTNLPPVSNERYIVPEKALSTETFIAQKSEIVIAQKPPPADTLIPVTPGEPIKPIVLPRRNYADITARTEFAHAHDHSWLVGTLNYVPQKSQWRLRYTSIDDEDRFGGSVTLDVGPQLMKPYQDGYLVRVEGSVVEPESRQPSPLYRVRTISLVSK